MGGENNSILELSFQMGETLLRNGAEISRVQETMERVAQSYHAESFNVYVLTNGIFAVGKRAGQRTLCGTAAYHFHQHPPRAHLRGEPALP